MGGFVVDFRRSKFHVADPSDGDSVFPAREKLFKSRSLSLGKRDVHCKHVGMNIAPELRFEHSQLFVWWELNDMVSGQELLNGKMDEIECHRLSSECEVLNSLKQSVAVKCTFDSFDTWTSCSHLL